MDQSARDQIDRLQTHTADTIGRIEAVPHEARTRKGTWTENEIEYWLHPTLHMFFVLVLDLVERVTNLEGYVIRAAEDAETVGSRRQVAYLTGRDRQDMDAAVPFLRSEDGLIRGLVDLHREVTPVDRANLGTELTRMLDRFIGHENRLRAIEGKPPIPMRDEWESQ